MQFVTLQDINEISNKTELSFIQDKSRFQLLFEKINFPVTLVIESFYSDRDYKDIYYYFYASKYCQYSKYSHRIAIFEGVISSAQFYDKHFDLNEKLIGITTIRPLKIGCIGRTFLNPKKLKIPKSFVRTTRFEFAMLGRKLYIDSFAFSSQDGEYMSCAETSLWSLLYYYGSRYKEYKVALPHEIIDIVDDKYFQRVSPTKGLSYIQSSEVLKRYGFSTQVYYRFVEDKDYYEPDNQFKRLYHYYVESGIPIMVGIRFKKSDYETGHAVVCIGHGAIKEKDDVYELIGNFQIANSADFIDSYVYIDDNKHPFTYHRFDEFDYKDIETKIKYFIVPLYKKIFLDAHEAEATFYTILKDEFFGLKHIENTDKFIIRIFLTTVRNYKANRFMALNESYRVLDTIPMPKFIWVCEISKPGLFSDGKIIGEVVLDATASKSDKLNQIILIRYPTKFAWKIFNDTVNDLAQRLKPSYPKLEKEYCMYKDNLMEVN